MTRKKLGFEAVREAALRFEGVTETASRGISGFNVHGKLMVCPAINKSADPNSLVARVGFDQRDALIAEDPGVYYLTDHYVKHPVVLVRLSEIDPNTLRDLVEMAWRFVTAKEESGKVRARRSGTR